ncbi:hypothetical protein [Saccharothrix coeruleofusca]|uniref:Uncharacterized protein n=1 Tax=Saccharothrix coeruleofusca TaxID=33919 RepID=A0A918ECL1_9PSEU|nr:hypothetical protein [Saccharothrix coeruleofusca]MBP2338124.1 hypothetical protein [Saccharothrix coeruleofusca]GGP50601.1 hypothetical protein GCM10010185_23610 [Saccharothrix coeruleofusca]
MLSTVDDLVYSVVMPDGSTRAHEFPDDLPAAFSDVRHLLYEPDLGTWFSVRLVLDPPDSFRVSFNFEVDPVWDPPIDPAAYAADLEVYPRSAANTPDWLRRVLAVEQSA